MLHVVRRDPRQFGVEQTRWRLADLHQVCDWLRLRTSGGLSQLLARLGVSYKRARGHVHSPDALYRAKLQRVQLHLGEALRQSDRMVLLFQDEFTYTRQPTLADAYAATGHDQALAELGQHTRATWRIAAALDALRGQVVYRQARRLTLSELVAFYEQIAAAYPQAETIYLVQDNWPVHFHPDVRAALRPHPLPWAVKTPPNWPSEPSSHARHLDLPIQLVTLPTYASWTNPIEKLWRWLRQDVLHVHRFGDDWLGLKTQVGQWLDRLGRRAEALLRYVGLADPTQLYHALQNLDAP